MNNDILEKAAADLLCIPPLIFRGIRKKLVETTLSDVEVHVTPHNFEIMRLLDEEGTMPIARIGESLQIAKAQMTQLIDRLVDLHLIEKKSDEIDRRITNINLTKKGKSILEEHKNSKIQAIKETLSSLSDEDLQNVSDSLRKLRNIFTNL